MAATVTTATLAAGYTQQTLADAVVTILTPVYGAPLARFSNSGTLRAVFALPKAQAGEKDAFVVVDVTTGFAVTHYLATSFTAPTTVGTLSAGFASTFSTTSQNILLTLFHKAGEFDILLLTQGTSTRGYFGWLIPVDLPSWWNRASFIPDVNLSSSSFAIYLFSTTNNPFNSASTSLSLNSQAQSLSSENPATLKRDVVKRVGVCHSSGYLGSTSEDIGVVAGSGMSVLDTVVVTAGAEEYVVIDVSTPAKVLRTVG